tara:strand:- start:31 stop:345 length:315 start_codon:yes stop_codon:yes gene_type:complete
MLDKPTRIGNSELYNVRVLNMSVARYYGVQKEYIEALTKARNKYKHELEKEGEKAELKLYNALKCDLNVLVLEQLLINKPFTYEELKALLITHTNLLEQKNVKK